ncbi:MAG TPA: sigma 54-interacting transcriptional regulator [Candidatus Eisenbacteria bacterium]|nr:sigma 54-interacting transcriptional regulator [Candidatus Eisenbacteria bacterium]
MQKAIPPGFPGDTGLASAPPSRLEEFGDLSQAADNASQALDYYRSALAELNAADALGRVRLLYKVADCLRRRGDLDGALLHLRAAHEALRPLADPLWTGRLAGRFAYLLSEKGEYRRAARYAHLAYELLRRTSEHADLARAEVYLGIARLRLGQYLAAQEAFTSALATFRRIDAPEGLAMCFNNLGLVHKNLGQWSEATRCLEQALRLNEKIGNYALVATQCLNIGILRYRRGEWDLAEESLLRARQMMAETEDASGDVQVGLSLGNLHRRRRQFASARDLYRKARVLAEKQGLRRELILADEFEAELDLEENAIAPAVMRLERALLDARRVAPAGDLVAEVSNRLALAHLWAGRLDAAHKAAHESYTICQRQGDRCEQAVAGRLLGLVSLARGEDATAAEHVTWAQRTFEELGERYELARTFLWTGRILVSRGRDSESGSLWESTPDLLKRAAALFRELGVPAVAAEAALLRARLVAPRGQQDVALADVEHALQWMREAGEPDAEERAAEVRREIEAQSVASSLSVSNEFRALEEANRLFRDAVDVRSVLASMVKLAVEHAGGDRGFVAFASGGGRLDVVGAHNLGADRARKMLRVLEKVGGRDVSNGSALFASRVAADPRFHADLSGPLTGVFSLVMVPLSFPSQAIGLVYVDRLNDNVNGAFKQRDLNLLAVLAQSAAVAMVELQRSVLLEENIVLKQQLKPTPGLERVVTTNGEMLEILNLLSKVGNSTATILLMGETGTGKGLLAHSVHEISDRKESPFVAVNCAALPENLLESELFGYVQGAFTGATRDKRGLFQEADGGTIFLDEVEKISEPVQAKLLQVLDQGVVRPVGSTKTVQVDARVLCATNCDLKDRIKQGKFLEDLYYRLNDISITVPPLRERREDIPPLVEHFLRLFSRQMDKPLPELAPATRRAMLEHEWRGNVRELEKTIKRLVVLWDGEGQAGVDLLPSELRETSKTEAESPNGFDLRAHIETLERRVIREALETYQWNKSQAARSLGLSYPTLLSKIRLLGIDRRTKRVGF